MSRPREKERGGKSKLKQAANLGYTKDVPGMHIIHTTKAMAISINPGIDFENFRMKYVHG